MEATPLAVEHLTVDYSTRRGAITAVRDVSFSVGAGEVFGLVGASGSGKTTILDALVGLLPRSASVRATSLRVGGAQLAGASEAEFRRHRGRTVALIPQHPMTALSPVVSVGRQLSWYFGERVHSDELVEQLVAMGLQAVVDRPDDLPSQFSGGQLQRLVLAIAVHANRPALLLADEPTATLDPTVQAQVLELLRSTRRQLGMTMVYVSHDLGVVAHLCDRVGVLADGSLVEVGRTRDVFTAPEHPRTEALLEAAALP